MLSLSLVIIEDLGFLGDFANVSAFCDPSAIHLALVWTDFASDLLDLLIRKLLAMRLLQQISRLMTCRGRSLWWLES